MSLDARPELTCLINLMGVGDDLARSEALAQLYDSMLEVAGRMSWSGGRSGQTQAIELAHQGILKLSGGEHRWNDRGHFLATFARAIQSARVDGLRSRQRLDDALIRMREGDGDGQSEELAFAEDGPGLMVLALNEALATLEAENPLAAEVVRLRYFAQATHREVADDLGIPIIRARRLWDLALNRLRVLLDAEPA